MTLKPLIPVITVVGALALFAGCSTSSCDMPAAPSKSSAAAPCMAVLDRFTAADVPAIGPAEIEVPPTRLMTNPPPADGDLPGKGLAQHPMLYIGEGYNKMFLVNDGKIIWTYSTGRGNEYDDIW